MTVQRPVALWIASLVCAGSLAGCYKGPYNETLADLEARSATLAERNDQLASANERISELEAQKADVNAELSTSERTVRGAFQEVDELTRRLAEAQQRLLELDSQLTSTRSMSASQREALDSARAEQQALLTEVNRLRQEAEQRQAIYGELIGRFQSMIEAGELDVSIRNGRIVINLPQDILFGSASAQVSREGNGTITNVGEVLSEFRDREFQIEGHTDNVPISTARFPSNWELSAARALAVVKILEEAGVRPENLSGAGYGEFRPVAENDSRSNRALNRRIEIVMLPNIEEFAPELNAE